MRDINVIDRVKALCKERDWSYYRLAKAAKIPYSTLNNMLQRNNIPTIPTLQKMCDGMGITLSDFFSGESDGKHLTSSQAKLLDIFSGLNVHKKELLIAYGKGLGAILE